MSNCRVFGCSKTVPSEKLMCYSHWKQVPGEMQKRVYEAWNKFLKAKTNQEKLLAVKTLRLEQDTAINAVQLELKKKLLQKSSKQAGLF